MDLRPTCSKCGDRLDAGSMQTISFGKYACKVCPKDEVAGIKIEQGSTDTVGSDIFFNKNYQCGDCNFRFSRSPSFEVSSCPYCASEQVFLENEELLNE